MEFQLSKKEEALYRKVAKDWVSGERDAIFFIQEFCKLKDQRTGRAIPFVLWPCQREQLQKWQENRLSITLKTRQIGISWLSAAFILWKCLFNRFFEAMAVSRKESDAIKYLDKARFMYNNLPELFKQMVPLLRENRLMMEFGTESVFMAESSNPEAGRSETLNAIVIDEAGFVPDAASIWTAAEPTLEKADGQAIIISTGAGYDKFFQPTYEAAKEGTNGFAYSFISWYGDPNRDDRWYEIRENRAKANGRLREFRAEYPRNDVEAFIVSGQTFFDPGLISRFLNAKQANYDRGYLSLKGPINYIPHEQGWIKIWDPPRHGSIYCLGVDVAEGIEAGDNSIAAVYDRHTRKQVAEVACKLDTDEFSTIVERLGFWYNKALICLEMNTVGESVMNYLAKQKHYPRLFRQMRYDEVSKKKVKKLGWRTTTTSKRTMLDALGAFLREGEMEPLSYDFFEELKTFVMIRTDYGNYKYEASGNKKDDRVIAHALCAIVFQEAPPPPPMIRNIRSDPKERFNRTRKPTINQRRVEKMFA